MCRLPLRSTHFPYTTLFRSCPPLATERSAPSNTAVELTVRTLPDPTEYGLLTTKATLAPVTVASPPLSRLSRSEEHTSELQSQSNLVCRLLLEKKKKIEHI